MAEAYIVATARTAGGRKGGRLAGWHPADLAASVLDSLVERTGADPAQQGEDRVCAHGRCQRSHSRRTGAAGHG